MKTEIEVYTLKERPPIHGEIIYIFRKNINMGAILNGENYRFNTVAAYVYYPGVYNESKYNKDYYELYRVTDRIEKDYEISKEEEKFYLTREGLQSLFADSILRECHEECSREKPEIEEIESE